MYVRVPSRGRVGPAASTAIMKVNVASSPSASVAVSVYGVSACAVAQLLVSNTKALVPFRLTPISKLSGTSAVPTVTVGSVFNRTV